MPETQIDRSQVSEINGNVTRMPLLGGRPCFGNPVAWAVHGRVEVEMGRNGLHKTRCGRCKARLGCERVSEARLSATPEIADAEAAFRRAGQRTTLRTSYPNQARRALGQLVRALQDHGQFTSVNDSYAEQWVTKQREQNREKARKRKRDERARNAQKALREHQIPSVLEEQLETERQYRSIRYRQYRDSGHAPRSVTLDPKAENDRFTADAWLARARLMIMNKPTTDYAVATEMIKMGRGYDLAHPVLRQRLIAARKRIDLIERTLMPGSSELVWPPFNAKTALQDLMSETPYESETP